jgi:two-component system, NarL family, sensor kinase
MRPWFRPAREDPISDTSEIRSALIRFTLVGLVSLVLVAIPTVLLFQRIALYHGLQTASESGRLLAVRVLAPQTTTAAIAGDKAALARIDAIARARMRDGSVVHMKIWDLTGRIIYSDAPTLIGRSYRLPEESAALSPGNPTFAEVTTLNDPENAFNKGPDNQLVEVYTLSKAITGEQLIFEAYFPISLVTRAQHDLLVQVAPVGLAALVILSLAQLPSALQLARQVRSNRQSRRRLLVQAVGAADHERRALAQELHDDVIQDLAGVGYALSSLSGHLDEEHGPDVERIALIVRRDVDRLRAMVTELYPQLNPQSLRSSLTELGSALREAGVQVDVDVNEHLALDETTATLVFRVARETLHNARKHAQPRNVEVRLASLNRRTVLTVVDDGQGFDPTAEPPAGHFGLRLIRDLVAEAGGTLLVDSGIGRGTRVELNLPPSWNA